MDGTLIPGNLEASQVSDALCSIFCRDKRLLLDVQVPQMIVLTFDDAVNSENWDLYINKLFIPER